MLIEADSSILKYLKSSKVINPMDTVLGALNNILNAVLLCQHVFWADYELLVFLEEHEYINHTNKIMLRFLIDRYSLIGSWALSMNTKIIVEDKEGEFNKIEKTYYVDVREFINIEKVKLIAEHGSDADAFIHIAEKYLKWNMQDEFSISFDKKSCYGCNVKDAIESCLGCRPIILCIIDSDKKYEGGVYGSTYKMAKNSVEKLNKKEIIELLTLNIKEKENLYPFEWYRFCDKNLNGLLKTIKKFMPSEEFLRFYDLKEGINVKNFKSADKKWNQLYRDFLFFCEKEHILVKSLHELEKLEEDDSLVSGIGAKAAERLDELIIQGKIAEELDKKIALKASGYPIPDEVIEDYEEGIRISTDIRNNLPDWLYNEWEVLGRQIVVWGLCFSQEFIPRYG